MNLRKIFVLIATLAVVAIPVAAADSNRTVVASANGGIHWTIPLPNAFGVEVVSQPLAFTALPMRRR